MATSSSSSPVSAHAPVAAALARGRTLLELSLSYLAAHAPVATVITGATSQVQVRANAAATGAWALTGEELDEVAMLLHRARAANRAARP